MTKNLKRNAIIAASAAAALSLVAVTPSFAHGMRGPQGPRGFNHSATAEVNRSATADVKRDDVARIKTSVAVTITGIPSTVTKISQITRGAKFVAYKLAADATAIPATQPTTGGKPVKVVANVAADNTVSYALELGASATASTTEKFAVYNAAGVGALVTVVTDAAGTTATATASAALTTVYAEPERRAWGVKKTARGF